ncbi:hypothetical protein RXV86_16360 [Alisedimentitalea sp. MJ-SS2]|uniref:hypothetical protein n=1 Tax=Aliisedimentitalea sp. MJ-SS2 TaxID=3049795 RepID=UPI00290AD4FA|nr:hypothetical protein [Alisedimentitalea sp. MJ-SS2]MDU8928968.1 hypothetical protein [Alisedimentitalea sp. MJ-SS2]
MRWIVVIALMLAGVSPGYANDAKMIQRIEMAWHDWAVKNRIPTGAIVITKKGKVVLR